MVHKEETYTFWTVLFQIYPIYKWAEKNLKTDTMSLDDIAKVYGFDLPPDKISLFRCDKKYAMTLSDEDLEQPLLVIDLGKSGTILIDGTHRAYKMWKQGKKTAKIYYVRNDDVIVKHSTLDRLLLEKLKVA